MFVEALAAQGRDETCRDVIALLLGIDASEAWQEPIRSALAAAGRADLWEAAQ